MKFNVPDMSCGHCTSTIEKAIKAADANASVSCDIPARTVSVEGALSTERLTALLREAGYENTVAAA
ncbi:heavy-metal-associated domain-containing protein [Marivivens sp. JLT3646]|jgi:copper chaperone|uniref:heavy-metal-associated domain-containing protein n=1 Tax=Marivivens sp. JLT3646 TaxID=1920883 RepID=UPI0007FBDB14|nr:heavy-metal-associated domain-containing protein [Marivivens sp. JLT3646]APO87381.1 heavy metal-binding protein [Marivivens sp. JLT3646]OBR35893.1 heavy metal-binding protein [Donghicola sp. JL3646]